MVTWYGSGRSLVLASPVPQSFVFVLADLAGRPIYGRPASIRCRLNTSRYAHSLLRIFTEDDVLRPLTAPGYSCIVKIKQASSLPPRVLSCGVIPSTYHPLSSHRPGRRKQSKRVPRPHAQYRSSCSLIRLAEASRERDSAPSSVPHARTRSLSPSNQRLINHQLDSPAPRVGNKVAAVSTSRAAVRCRGGRVHTNIHGSRQLRRSAFLMSAGLPRASAGYTGAHRTSVVGYAGPA